MLHERGLLLLAGGAELLAVGALDGLGDAFSPVASTGLGLDIDGAVNATEEQNKEDDEEASDEHKEFVLNLRVSDAQEDRKQLDLDNRHRL
ncbi:hypothetical protein [Humibacter ginsenosidimutans]|uniref:Uncharacterized protein n=1 Tax=Humibacter ginsenosidimutans TaxID=2599293 RepID=A0A5B8M682_9MICO|nr:hypothetical protein [Humibacter ginsenosidimutans]QDZ15863.1 hypothetical protein FPZ11_14755 [Humibacter ginsenosidimutans]